MKIENIDSGNSFDFGRTSEDYARYRDIYPESMYETLKSFGIGKIGQKILDLGSGTAVLPRHMYDTCAFFTASDISESQIEAGRKLAYASGLDRIEFAVCSAEKTGFPESTFDAVTAVQCFHYFDSEKASAEIYRVLKPQGLFCKVFMDWKPYEDDIVAEMERLVLSYNPKWSGGGFRSFEYSYPDWCRDRFEIDTIRSYDEYLSFSKGDWIGRIRTCRGVGASLDDKAIAAFEREYGELLRKYPEPLMIKHQIHIEIYKSRKK